MSPSGRDVAGEGHETDVSFPFSPPDASALLEVVGNIGGRGTEGMSLVSSQDNALSHIHTSPLSKLSCALNVPYI